MRKKINTVILLLISNLSIAQIKMDNRLQFVGATIADRTITGVSNLHLDGTIIMDGLPFVDNRNSNNILIGNTKNAALTGNDNIMIGLEAGRFLANSSNNIFVGYQAGWGNTNYSGNIGIGTGAAASNKANYNTMIGYNAGYNNSAGLGQAFLGYAAGKQNTLGNNNTAIGYISGSSVSATGNDYNTFINTVANKSSIKSTFIGAFSDLTTNGLTNVTSVGSQIITAANNTLIIGTSSGLGSPIFVGINTATPRCVLDINATGAMIVPVGTTTERPTSTTGMVRYNTSTNKMEVYNGTTWKNLNY